MRNYTVYIVSILMSLPAFCADTKLTGRHFIRINEESSTVETAYRSYLSPDGKTTIQLIAVNHEARPEFYQTVQSMIKGQVVLYELYGVSIDDLMDDEKKKDQRAALCGTVYEKRHKALKLDKYLDALGRVTQTALSYDGCAELVHADIKSSSVVPIDADGSLNLPDEIISAWTKEIIDHKVRGHFSFNGIKLIGDSQIDEQIAFLLPALYVSKSSKKELSLIERRGIKSECDDVDLIRSGQLPVDLFKSYGEKWKEVMVVRNEIIFATLKNVCSRNQVPARIAVVYGQAHMLFVEDYLLQNSYKPITGSEGWLVVAKLWPLPMPIENPVTDIKKTYLSTDGLIKIYLVGSPTNDKFSESDEIFVRSRIFGWEKSKNGQVMEIVYTPDDIDYVAENLLRSGFALINEAPFVRKNNKKWHLECDNSSYIHGGSFDVAIENNF